MKLLKNEMIPRKWLKLRFGQTIDLKQSDVQAGRLVFKSGFVNTEVFATLRAVEIVGCIFLEFKTVEILTVEIPVNDTKLTYQLTRNGYQQYLEDGCNQLMNDILLYSNPIVSAREIFLKNFHEKFLWQTGANQSEEL